MGLPKFDLGTVYLRDVCREDYLDLFDITRHEEVTRYLTYDSLKHPNEAIYMLEEFNFKRPNKGLPVGFAIVHKKTHKMIGMIEFHTYYPSINASEIGFILHPDFQKKGIMHRCLNEMINIGFYHYNYDKIIAACVDLNENSKKLILDCGFKYEYEDYSKFVLPNNELRSILYFSIYKHEHERKM